MQQNNTEPQQTYEHSEHKLNGSPDNRESMKELNLPIMHRNENTHISPTFRASENSFMKHSPDIKEEYFELENQNAQQSAPIPEVRPQLNHDEDISPQTPYLQEIDTDGIERIDQKEKRIVVTPDLNVLGHLSKPSNSAGRSSNAPTEEDEEKIDHIDQEQVHSRLSHKDDAHGMSSLEQMKFLNGQDKGNDVMSTPHSARSTVLIAESPRDNAVKEKEAKDKKEIQEAFETNQLEIEETNEETSDVVTTLASKAIQNVVTHDGPLIQPKPQEVSQANIATMKNKINLEVFLKVENLLYSIKENIMSGKPIYKYCRDYIEVAPKIDREHFEKIIKAENERKLLKSSFILKRLAIILMLYFTVENTPNDKTMFQLKSLINAVHQNFIIFGYLISLKLRDKSKSNIWIARLFELLEHDSTSNFSRSENLDKIAYNNNYLSTSMKTLIVTLKNKEILYAYNSVIVQLDRITMKEAYTRLLKSFSVFMSEKELKSQASQYHPKKPIVETKTQKAKKLKEAKEQLAFLPKVAEKDDDDNFTLVVDLDETLVHYAEIPDKLNELRVRPYVAYFLSEVSKYYEIVVFTAAMQEYADWVLDNIDKDRCITHRLYRQHASPDGYNFVKDLSKIGRNIKKTIIIDNLAENFRLQPDNGIYIKPWYDDHEDTALYELTPLLVDIAQKKVSDVRVALRQFRDQMLQNIESGSDNPHMNLKLE